MLDAAWVCKCGDSCDHATERGGMDERMRCAACCPAYICSTCKEPVTDDDEWEKYNLKSASPEINQPA